MSKIIDEIYVIIKLALPLMAAFLSQKGMQFIDTIMMGWIGPDALAAGSLGTSIFVTSIIFFMGTLSAVGVFIARARGENNLDDIQSTLQQGIYLSLFFSLPCMLLIWCAPLALAHMGENINIVHNTALLLGGLIWGIPGFLLFLTFREFISAFSLTKTVMIVTLGSLPLTFLVNYILIYGKWGFPALGIAGIGYGGAVIMWFMFFCLLIYSLNHHILKNYLDFLFKLKSNLNFNLEKIKNLLNVGLPSGVISILDASMFLFAAILMSFFSTDALAAHQIAMLCAATAYAIPFALSMSAALRVGHSMGLGDSDLAKKSAYIAFSLGIIISGFIAAVFIFFPENLAKIFINPHTDHYKNILHLATVFLAIGTLLLTFDAIQIIANGTLKGLKDTFVPMLISLACYWLIGASSAYYFAFHTSLGPAGIWYGLTLGICTTGFVLVLRFWRRIKLPLIHHQT